MRMGTTELGGFVSVLATTIVALSPCLPKELLESIWHKEEEKKMKRTKIRMK